MLLLLVCAFRPPDVWTHQVLTYLHGHQRMPVIISNVNDADAAEKKILVLVISLNLFSVTVCVDQGGAAHQRTSSGGKWRHLLDIKCTDS